MLLFTPAFAAPPTPAAPPPDPPNHAIVLSVEAEGRVLVGHVAVDADALAPAKITFLSGSVPRTGPVVPLVDGLRVLGLPQGERIVQGATDTLLYFDANGDTYLDAKDPAFAALRLFVDGDGDGKLDPGEVRSFADVGIDSISRYGSVRMKER
jgi:hypothetical protein